MPQTVDPIANAKAALSHANSAFSSKFARVATGATPAPAAPAKSASTPAAAPNLGIELAAKKTMMDKAKSALPKMHKGGPVKADGAYNLKAGEHVLTEPEAKLARKHALVASGLKSLAMSGKGAKNEI